MPTDEQLEHQLAEYFSWLEGDLGTTMRPPVSAAGTRYRRRLVAAIATAVVIGSIVGMALINEASSPSTIRPSSTSPGDSSVGSSSSISPASSTGASGAVTWAPLNLPVGMEVVGVYNGLVVLDPVQQTPVQHFARFDAAGSTMEAQLVFSIHPGDANGFVTDTEVHGLPATMLHPSSTSVSVAWDEGGNLMSAMTAGLTDDETIALLDATTLRDDPLQGIEPTSVRQGMAELFEHTSTYPKPWASYVVHDTATDTFIWAELGASTWGTPKPFAPTVEQIVGVGRLFHDADGRAVLLTDDGLPVMIGHPLLDRNPNERQQRGVAASFAPAIADDISRLRTSAATILGDLPEVAAIAIDGRTLVLRGGTTDVPTALCLRTDAAEACHFNAVNRVQDLLPIDQRAITSITIDGQWFVVGYNMGGVDNVVLPYEGCAAGPDGSVTSVLPDVRDDVAGREYFTAAIPADVDFVRSCYVRDGVPVAGSSGLMVRPSE